MKKFLLLLFLLTLFSGYSQPSSPAPTPTKLQADVVSFYSDTYTAAFGTVNWTNATDSPISGNATKLATSVTFTQGATASTSITGMTFLHVDIYSTNANASQIKVQVGGTVGAAIATPNGVWTSLDIPLSNYSNPSTVNLVNLQPYAGAGTFYFDNIYFYKPASVPATPAPTPNRLQADVVSFYSDTYTAAFGTVNWTNATDSPISGNATKLATSVTFAQGATASTSITGMTFLHVDIFSTNANASQMKVQVGGTVGAAIATPNGVWTSLDIPLSNYSSPGTVNLINLQPYAGAGTFYFDNIYFYKIPSGPSAAPTPTNLQADVVSFYSDAYTAAFGTVNWTNATDSPISGNATKLATNVTFAQGATASTSISGMTFIHVDVYSTNANASQIKVQVNGTVGSAIATPNGVWTSLDIPLSNYGSPGTVNLVSLQPYAGSGTFYFDNVYFYKLAGLPAPTIGSLTVPAKSVGDAPFVLTNPTSNSSGAFTYTSSNTGVATISGNTVTIVGAGSSTITATQATDGTYSSGFVTATLTVSYSPPASAAPTPPARNAWDVVSLYSGAYTPTTGATWGAAGTDVAIAGDNARFFNGFTLSRLSFAAVNLTTAGMTTLHIDVYTHNQNQLWFELNSNRKVVSSIALNGWVSFDIPLTDYVGLNLANISFFDLNNPTGATPPAKVVYLDNIYFWRAATSPAPTFGAFTVPAKLVGDAPFNLTDPTSNSTGTFTYTSSNTGVATVSGNTVTIVGIGSTTITANQAASAPYSAGSTTATLNVTAPAPTVAAPTPPARNAWDVVSIYSGAYTPVAGTRNYNPDWGQSGRANFAQPLLGGDEVLKYSGVNYQGISINNGATISAAGMTHLHIDIWTTNRPSTDIRIIDTGDKSVIRATAGGVWNSLDIPLTDFTGLNIAAFKEFKFQSSTGIGTTSEWFIDNIYFYRAATLLPPTLGAFTVPAKLTNSAPFALTAPTSNSPGAFSYTSSNTAVATISGSTVTIVGNGTTIITATQASDGSFGIGTTTANLVVTFPVPTVAAPTPTVPSGNVISIFSNAYTNQAGTDFNPNWGQQGSVADVLIAGNTTKRYSSFNYQGTQFTTINGVTSNLQTIHFDFLSPNTNLLKVSLISNTTGGEKAVLISTTPLNSWKSVDILLSQFSSQGLNLTGLFQIKIENYNNGGANNGTLWVSGGELYIDNIYFSDVVTNVAPIISGFTIPIKLVGDAPFNLTTPSSSSAGAFTYTSSNTNVATISGNTVTVIGAGTSVITATQAANGSYTSGSITANLVVSGGPTGPAPSPTVSPLRVSSVYSNSYNNSSYTYDNYGGSSSASEFGINNNPALRFKNLGRLGLNITGSLNVTGLTNLHLDINTPNVTKFNVILFNGGVQTLYSLTTTLNGWNSFDLNITGQTKVDQILLVASPDAINTIASTITTGIAYVDNVYFYTTDNVTKLMLNQCGSTITALDSPIYCNGITGATDYRFKVTKNGVDYFYDNDSKNIRAFALTQVSGVAEYNKSYSVSVSYFSGGVWSAYGTPCSINTPALIVVNTTQIMLNRCGTTLPALNTIIYANAVIGATQYRFEVTGGSFGLRTFDTPNRYFTLSQLSPGGGESSTTYSIRVAINNGTWQSYGPACNVSTPAPISRMAAQDINSNVFEVKTFPNPFARHFSLDIQSSSDDLVQVRVYDMIGRDLEVQKATVSELSTKEIGTNYPSGVYNVIVSQGDKVKSVRMIKR